MAGLEDVGVETRHQHTVLTYGTNPAIRPYQPRAIRIRSGPDLASHTARGSVGELLGRSHPPAHPPTHCSPYATTPPADTRTLHMLETQRHHDHWPVGEHKHCRTSGCLALPIFIKEGGYCVECMLDQGRVTREKKVSQ